MVVWYVYTSTRLLNFGSWGDGSTRVDDRFACTDDRLACTDDRFACTDDQFACIDYRLAFAPVTPSHT